MALCSVPAYRNVFSGVVLQSPNPAGVGGFASPLRSKNVYSAVLGRELHQDGVIFKMQRQRWTRETLKEKDQEQTFLGSRTLSQIWTPIEKSHESWIRKPPLGHFCSTAATPGTLVCK